MLNKVKSDLFGRTFFSVLSKSLFRCKNERVGFMQKVVISGSTFLWKEPKDNKVLLKIEKNPKERLHTFLTNEDTMRLYEERLTDSEVTYGTVVEVLSEENGWSQVIVLDQASNKNSKGYPGYISTECLSDIAKEHKSKGKVAVVAPIAELRFNETTRFLPFGTTLEWIKETEKEYLVNTPDGKAYLSKEATQKTESYSGNSLAKRMVDLAEQFIELPYIWSGVSGCGFDCSGFMYSLHRVNGVLIPRDTPEQAEFGKHVAYKDAEPGDLLLFAYEKGRGEIHHVGMYIGNDEMIHSHTPGSKVMKSKISGSKYETELIVVSRYWE